MYEHELTADPFVETDQEDLVGFSCGDSLAGRYCTEWIRGTAAAESISRHQTKVWLYRNRAGDVVGFASIGTVRWRWPLPDGNYCRLIFIPMLGIDCRFQGKPEDPAWRYSHQILEHLIHEAHAIRDSARKPIEWLALYVHLQNERAIKLYQSFDFVLIEGVVRGADMRVMMHRLADEAACP